MGNTTNEVIILDDEQPEVILKEAAVVLTRLPNPETGPFTQLKAVNSPEVVLGNQRKIGVVRCSL